MCVGGNSSAFLSPLHLFTFLDPGVSGNFSVPLNLVCSYNVEENLIHVNGLIFMQITDKWSLMKKMVKCLL